MTTPKNQPKKATALVRKSAGEWGPDELRERVIEMYQEGEALSAITRTTGVPRASIYWIIRKAGLEPDRAPTGKREDLSIAQVLDHLRAVERENGMLREQLDRERALNDAILGRLGLTPERMLMLIETKKAGPARPRKTANPRQSLAN